MPLAPSTVFFSPSLSETSDENRFGAFYLNSVELVCR